MSTKEERKQAAKVAFMAGWRRDLDVFPHSTRAKARAAFERWWASLPPAPSNLRPE